MNFMYLSRLLTLLSIKLDFVDDKKDISYSLIRMISSSSTCPWFVSFICSLFLYNSCISLILLFTYWFPYLLYASNSSANMHWTWYAQSSMLLWIRYCRSSHTPRIFIVFVVQLLMLAFRIIPFISVIVIFASSAIFIISHTCFCTSIIVSNPFNVLWYNLVQSLLWDALDINNFCFILFYFSILLYFFFCFFFFLKNDEEARDNEVTWQVTWMWRHKPRTWWKGLEDDVRAYEIHMCQDRWRWTLFYFSFSIFILLFLSFLFLFLLIFYF